MAVVTSGVHGVEEVGLAHRNGEAIECGLVPIDVAVKKVFAERPGHDREGHVAGNLLLIDREYLQG